MALFDTVFNAEMIYKMLFFNVKTVLIYPTLDILEKENPQLFKRWEYLQNTKYSGYDAYHEKAIHYPEFAKIVAITYATLDKKKFNETKKRDFKKIVNVDEKIVVSTFMDVLHQKSSDSIQSSPQEFEILCGHNIINYDIPLLIKRHLLYRNEPNIDRRLPFMIKRTLDSKPWESTIIDTVNVWKFNGNDYTPLMLVADYLGLKKNVDLDTLPEVSKKYWELIDDKPAEALEYISTQSINQTNLVIQLIDELRKM